MQTSFKSYHCNHTDNRNMQVPNNCPMETTTPNKFCIGCQYLEIKMELI